MGGFLFGFDTAVINGAVSALYDAFNATSWGIGLSVSTALLGSAVGAFFAGGIADRYGRVKTMIIASILFTISAIGSGIAVGLWDFIFWRVLYQLEKYLLQIRSPQPPLLRGARGDR